MTVNDPIIHVAFGPSEIVLAGIPEEYLIRGNDGTLTDLAKEAAAHPKVVRYGNMENNLYLTGNHSMEELFLAVVSPIPKQAEVLKAPQGLYERFWTGEENEPIFVTRGTEIPAQT